MADHEFVIGNKTCYLSWTGRYLAPEVFKNEAYDTKVDVFSFALILQEVKVFFILGLNVFLKSCLGHVTTFASILLYGLHFKVHYMNSYR